MIGRIKRIVRVPIKKTVTEMQTERTETIVRIATQVKMADESLVGTESRAEIEKSHQIVEMTGGRGQVEVTGNEKKIRCKLMEILVM